jgi:MFS family permease
MAVPYFLLLNTSEPALIWLALVLLGIGVYLMYGPQPAFFTELFPANVRYTAFSLPVAVATILGGSTAPIVATTLVQWGDGTTRLVSAYLVLTGLVTALCGLLTRETLPRLAEPRAPQERTGRFSRSGGVTVSDRP